MNSFLLGKARTLIDSMTIIHFSLSTGRVSHAPSRGTFQALCSAAGALVPLVEPQKVEAQLQLPDGGLKGWTCHAWQSRRAESWD